MTVHDDSQMSAEARERRRRMLATESAWIRSQEWCRCRKPVEGPVYLRHKSCRVCGKLCDNKRY